MKILSLDHFAINVIDLEQSKKFYSEILNLKELDSISMDDHTLYYYELPGGVRLELIDYMDKSIEHKGQETDVGMYRHFCISVDKLDEISEVCKRKKVFIKKEASYVEKLNCETMLIVDPNNEEIEIIQR